MKKFFVLFVFMLGFSVAVQAQGISLGAKGGLNVANVGGDDVTNNNALARFYLGGFANVAVNEKFSIQPELVYSQQGANFEIGSFDADAELDYLNLPVMLRYNVVETFYFEGGPQLGILLDDNFGGDVESTDFGLGLGLGVELPIKLGFNLRYNLGLTDVVDGASIQNRVFQVGVNYRFVSVGD